MEEKDKEPCAKHEPVDVGQQLLMLHAIATGWSRFGHGSNWINFETNRKSKWT